MTSLVSAIGIVGTDRVKTMATLVAVNRMVRVSARVGALRKVWIHSLVTAIIAEEAARVAAHGTRKRLYGRAAAQPGNAWA